jgi:hypothetical protein
MLSNFNTETQWRPKQVFMLLLGNVLPLLLALYGLKCIVTLRGSLTEPDNRVVLGQFYLAPVKGMAVVMVGLGDIALASFGYLSCGPPKEDRPWLCRMARGIIRWGSLAATYFLWHESHKLRLGML